MPYDFVSPEDRQIRSSSDASEYSLGAGGVVTLFNSADASNDGTLLVDAVGNVGIIRIQAGVPVAVFDIFGTNTEFTDTGTGVALYASGGKVLLKNRGATTTKIRLVRLTGGLELSPNR